MFRTREFRALPINWREIYKVDKMSDVPKYAWNNRGTLIEWNTVIPCMFKDKEEAEEFYREHHKWGLVRQKEADWWMSSEPEIIEIDPESLQEVKREYILCAAIWYKDGTEAPRGMIAQNIDSGVVIGQWRHGNCINVRATNPLWNSKKLAERLDRDACPVPMTEEKPGGEAEGFEEVDGFITSEGRFVDRWQGMKLAYEAGQVSEKRAFRNPETIENDAISDKELMEGQPQYRRGNQRGRYNMMYSEDLY